MISSERIIWKRLNNLLDFTLTILSFGISYQLRNYAASIKGFEDIGSLAPFEYYAPVMIIAAITWSILINVHGLHAIDRFNKMSNSIVIILRASIETLVFLIIILYIFQIGVVSRFLLLAFAFLNCAVLVIKQGFVQFYYSKCRFKDGAVERILVVGNIESVTQFIARLKKHSYLGLVPTGVVLEAATIEVPKEICGVLVLGTLDRFLDIIHSDPIDQVVFTAYNKNDKISNQALTLCADEGIEAWIIVDIFDRYMAKANIETFDGLPVLAFPNAPILTWHTVIKNIFDRLLAIILLLILSPLFLIIASGVLLTSGFPIFFRQKRAGLHTRPTTLLKFQSMKEGQSSSFGLWLRKTSLDELPQLINIIKGEMSFVGPRPHIPEEVDQYKDHRQRRRLSVKPGLTGLRQISKSAKVSFDEQLELDLRYIDDWSFFGDIVILVKTIPSVAGRFFGLHSKEVH